jgi:acyl-CoA dehydrogenase
VNGVFTEEEEAYRDTVRRFLRRELGPHVAEFAKDTGFDKALWRRAGEAGILGAAIPEAYGGPGASDLCGVVLAQELGRSPGGAVAGLSLSADICTRVLFSYGSQDHKRRFASKIMSGEVSQCLPVTETHAGSDATAIRTTARRDGFNYVINGSKVYISNGNKAHLMYVAAKTDAAKRGGGMSVFLVEGDMPGVSRRPMKTMGYDAYDLAELRFDNVVVPADNLLLAEGRGLEVLISIFALDRMEIGARALGEAELAFQLALDFVRSRKAFGQAIIEFQNTQFKLAEMKTDIEVGQSFLNDAVRKHRAGVMGLADCSMVKLWLTEMSSRVIDSAMQMFGGSGFMDEMTIARLYRCNRLHRLYAGSSELLKVAIAREIQRA